MKADYTKYLVKEVMSPFHQKRLSKLQELKLPNILKRKNPYLFKAKNITTAGELIKSILDAFLSSQEETLFGNLLESFAIHISHTLYGGLKSSLKSIDLEFQRDSLYYVVSIKSGPNWGNSDQISQLQSSFKLAKEKLKKQGIHEDIVAVNGCIYGKDSKPFKEHQDTLKSYYKYCGQDFWHFISEEESLYQDIIIPLDKAAKKKDEAFKKAYAAKNNELTREFLESFMSDNQIDWVKFIDFVSKRGA